MKELYRFTALVGVLSLVAMAEQPAQAREPNMPRGERTFEQLDKNKDGNLALEELEARSVGRFMRLDADKNDAVSRTEMENWLHAIAKRRIDRILSRMDGDGDASVSRDELRSYISKEFGAADADKSGGVTLQESRDYLVVRRKLGRAARKAVSAGQQ